MPEHPAELLLVEGPPRIALSITPPKSGPVCLFLHGIGGGKYNWDAQLGAVVPLMQAASMDLRGYGESELGASPSTVEDYCNDILRVMAALEKHHVILCGLSYGAWIATSFAMRHPEKLSGLILSGGCTGMSEASQQERDTFRNAREVPMNDGNTPADFAPAVVKVIAGPHASDQIKQNLHASMAAIPVATYRDALQCFTAPKELFDFSRIACPVLMMTGEHDKLASPAEIQNVADRIRAANPKIEVRFEIISKAGHVCNLEAPEIYNTHLIRFLNSPAINWN